LCRLKCIDSHINISPLFHNRKCSATISFLSSPTFRTRIIGNSIDREDSYIRGSVHFHEAAQRDLGETTCSAFRNMILNPSEWFFIEISLSAETTYLPAIHLSRNQLPVDWADPGS
jgi:hypothetical protein